MGNFVNALKTFFLILRDKQFADSVEFLKDKENKELIEKLKSSEFAARVKRLESGALYEPSQILSLLQREGRFIDFLQENLSSYQDAQIGAVARTVHQGCQKVLKEYIIIEPVIKESEGARVTVPEGFDPSAIRLVGNVSGNPPFNGALTHHGWKISSVKIPSMPPAYDTTVIMPAEVEI